MYLVIIMTTITMIMIVIVMMIIKWVKRGKEGANVPCPLPPTLTRGQGERVI